MNSLSPKQRNAALLISAGHTNRQVAKLLKITPQTISEWSNRLDFQDLINAHLRDVEAATIKVLQALRLRAVERLRDLLESKSPMVAIRAVALALAQPQSANTPPPSSPPDIAWTAIIQRLSHEAEQTKLH